MHSFVVFGPEAIAEMSEALDAAFEELQDTGEPDVCAKSSLGELLQRQNLVSTNRLACRQPRSADRASRTFRPWLAACES
jgi:hypothetical protein